jgi:hypothetical protein
MEPLARTLVQAPNFKRFLMSQREDRARKLESKMNILTTGVNIVDPF